MRIIAYTYEADYHCCDCARKRFKSVNIGSGLRDEQGVAIDAEDREGNPVHPVFSTDETEEGRCCGDCHCNID